MIKTYKLTTPVRNSSIVLRGKSGNTLRYNFSGGDPLTNKPATVILKGMYSQELLESSDLFAKGIVRLVTETQGGEEVPEKEYTIMDGITSTEQLIEFVNVNLEPKTIYKQPKAALAFAERRGYKFPNLKID